MLPGQDSAVFPDPQMDAHARQNLFGVNRFSDIIDATDFQPGYLVLDVMQGGQEDDRNVGGGRVRLEFGAGLESALARHHHVEQNEVGSFTRKYVPGRRAVISLEDTKPLRRQDGLEHGQVGWRIIYNENRRNTGHRSISDVGPENFIGNERKMPTVRRGGPQWRSWETFRSRNGWSVSYRAILRPISSASAGWFSCEARACARRAVRTALANCPFSAYAAASVSSRRPSFPPEISTARTANPSASPPLRMLASGDDAGRK